LNKQVHIRLYAAFMLLLMALLVAPMVAFHECGHGHEPLVALSDGPALDEDSHCAMCDMVIPEHKATPAAAGTPPPASAMVLGVRYLMNRPWVAAVAVPCRGPPLLG
jgi:hypothetical protein